MAWAAIDCFLKGKGGGELDEQEHQRLAALRERIHEAVCREGFNAGLGSFTSYFGGQDVDASLLLLPKVDFLPMSDPRMAGTVARIERTLVVDGLVRRHLMNDPAPEGAFIACSFWLAECQIRQGRRAEAVGTIERAISVGSDLGLLSEEYDVASKRLCGNYPQALSHLALIHAVLALDHLDRSSDGR
jgi:GH15 family glucan-1,4-alpha-glucosidase